MTDIVERLRRHGGQDYDTRQHAADEIERLRAKCAAYDAALERIAGGDGYYPEIAMAKLTAIRAYLGPL